MKILELKKLIKDIPDDFDFHVDVSKKVSKEELETREYRCLYNTERCETYYNNYDIGWSDKGFKIDVEIKSL